MAKEYWRWKEYNWKNEEIDWKSCSIISAGVDVGSVSSQAVVLVDGELFVYSNMRTGSNSPMSAQNAMSWALENLRTLSTPPCWKTWRKKTRSSVPPTGKK